ncbi:MAG: flavodoxin [Pontiella sp.]
MKTVIVYGSMTGTTKTVAETLGAELQATVVAATDADAASLENCDLLILGASTWGMGELQDDMADFLSTFDSLKVSASAGAVFGLGDQFGYADSFVDGIADMAQTLADNGIKRIGNWPNSGYLFSESRALNGDSFSGLPLDEDNESEKTEARISAWAKQLKSEAGA